MNITDKERLGYLMQNGYLPEDNGLFVYLVEKGVDVTILLDWCLSRGYGPAYWREPRIDPDGLRRESTDRNGLVFVGNCDRARIDEILRRKASLPQKFLAQGMGASRSKE